MLVISCRHMNAIAASSKLAPLTCNESKSEPSFVQCDNRLGTGLGYRLPFKISRHAMRSVAHGRVARRIARQEGVQQPSRLAV
jgi:hypothetical protein